MVVFSASQHLKHSGNCLRASRIGGLSEGACLPTELTLAAQPRPLQVVELALGDWPAERYDVISLLDVIDHLRDPYGDLFFSRRTIRQALERHGWETLDIRSVGHTFQLQALLNRAAMIWPVTKPLRTLVYPRWLLDANLYVNPGTKIIVYARPR